MRLLILVFLLLVFDGYAFMAIRTLVHNWQPSLRYLLYGVYWAVPALLLTWMLGSDAGWFEHWPKSTVTVVRTLFFIIYISKMLVAAVMLVDDLRRLVGWLANQLGSSVEFSTGRSRFLAQLGLMLGAVPFFSLIYGMVRNPYRYRLFREKVLIPGLPDALQGFKIVQISDIHSGSFLHKEPVRNAVDLINAQEPDLVFFTGDLVNNKAEEAQPFVDVFDKINARHGAYSVLGNHDYGDYVRWGSESEKAANMDLLKDTHRRIGWDLLLNEHRTLEVNGAKVAVIGVENYSTHPRFPKYGDLKQATEGLGTADLKLLLSHDPSHWEGEVTDDYKDIAITFSGHTHGMQFGVEIPGWIKWSPIKYVYKQWAGLYQSGQQFLYVNRGLGYLGYPGRVGILPEVTLIELQKEA
ncbi:metallophosphoesterase [Phaeodactylibacter sp.]|uniref:metallophosphoesterase n=1 Tax=Phaeodactylibacter sp. TaxID=1940289 RepID=UPI0025DD7D26|nr:metallophosphoesterase [Phaeodactylibacter sp.]MCI4650728.1 metallophosphoesterase [Phaeodactylibacter sp.]MCI5093070.1 metallophosphoesterase [Phaeodactylibacter sp.]